MPLYRYNVTSPIDEIKFLKNESGGFRAYLHASEMASPESLKKIYKQLEDTGHVIVPCNHHGRPMLEVRGFQTPDGLRATLSEADATVGTPIKDDLAEDKLTTGQWLKKYALFVIAGVYLASDWFYIKYEDVKAKEVDEKKEQYANEKLDKAIIAYNENNKNFAGFTTKPLTKTPEQQRAEDARKAFEDAKPKDWKGRDLSISQEFNTPKSRLDKFFSTLAGKGYLIGSSTSMLSLLLRGNTSAAETGDISRKVLEAAAKHGLTPESDISLTYAATLKDTRSQAVQKFSQYSSEIMNMSFATAGLAIARSNIKSLNELNAKEKHYSYLTGDDALKNDARHKSEKSVAQKDILIGVGTIASGVASSLMTERKHDPNKPKKKGIAGIVESMKENPLSIAGAGYLVSTFVHLWSSIQEFSSIKNDNKIYADKAHKEGKEFKPFPVYHTVYRLLFVVMNLIAETGMLFTSKGHGEGVRSDTTLDKTATSMVASLIHRQPKEMHDELVQKMAKELSNASAIAHPVDQVEKMIREQLANLDKNPWTNVIDAEIPRSVSVPKELLVQPAEERLDAAKPAVSQELLKQPVEERLDIPTVKPASAFGIAPRSKAPLVQTSLLDRAVANENVASAVMP